MVAAKKAPQPPKEGDTVSVDLSGLDTVEEYVSDTIQNIPQEIQRFVELGYEQYKAKPEKWLEKALGSEHAVKHVTALAKRYAAHRTPALTVRTKRLEKEPGKLVYKITDKQAHTTGAKA